MLQRISYLHIYRTFITTPILCYLLHMHDCMLAIVGGLSTVASDITIVSICTTAEKINYNIIYLHAQLENYITLHI